MTKETHRESQSPAIEEILGLLPYVRDAGQAIREILLANLVMLGEIPAPTFGESSRVEFVQNRFVEGGLQNASTDEIGNALGLLPGSEGGRNVLLTAHVDTVFPATVDHSITLQPDRAIGPGVGDNALGLAALLSLPLLLELLDLRLGCDLVLMGACRSRGRGDLEGLRFFLANTRLPLCAGINVEGFPLGGLSYEVIGSIRGEIICEMPEEYDWTRFGASGAIVTMNEVINRILEIALPRRPRSTIVLGSIEGGQAYNLIATHAVLRFEIRTESETIAEGSLRQIEDIIADVSARSGARLELDIFSRRRPGGISYRHPLPQAARRILRALGLPSRASPRTSELSAFAARGIPALSIGISQGEHLNEPDEQVLIEPIFTGLAQLIGILLAVDRGLCDGD